MLHWAYKSDRKMFDSEELVGRIVEWFRTGSSRPFMLELRPTNRCNLNCPSCVARGQSPYTAGEELSAEEYERIIDEAAELGVRYVLIGGGGEPFMRREKLLRIMHRVKQHGMAGFVVTNGTLFDPPLIQELFEMRWDAILFSVDGHNPKVNDFLRGNKGCFEKATSAIRTFARLKGQFGMRTPRLDIGPVLSHYNCGYVSELVRLGAELGVDNVLFQPVSVRNDKKGKPFMLTDDDLKALTVEIPRAQKLAYKLGVWNNLHELDRRMLEGSSKFPEVIQGYSLEFKEHPFLSIHCFSPWFYMGINADGTVGPCSIDHPMTYKGHIQGSSLGECWQKSHFQEFRESLVRGELPKACINCCGTNVIEIRKLRERLHDVISSGRSRINLKSGVCGDV